MSPEESSPPPLMQSLIRGSIWMTTLRSIMRLSGLISITILARLLTPEDFGLIALCAVIATFADLLFTFGVDVALIQKNRVTDDDLDAAWSLQVMAACGAAFLIAAVSPFAIEYYDDSRVFPVLLVLAAGVFIRGFRNTGVIFFKRDLQFNKEFEYQIYVTLLRIMTTIAAAWILRSYWALVLGTVIGQLMETVFSYVFHKYRPWFALSGIKELWAFSKWMIVLRIAQFLSFGFYKIILGGVTSSSKVGFIDMANDIATIPNKTVMGPLQQVLMPGFSKLKYDRRRLNQAYLKSLEVGAVLGLPACIGIALVAEELVPIMLGSQWSNVIPLVQILAFFGAAQSLNVINGAIMLAADMVKPLSLVYVFSAILCLLLVIPAHEIADVEGVAQLRALVSIATFVTLLYFVAKKQDIYFTTILSKIWRPFASTAAMFVAVKYSSPVLPSDAGIWILLIVKVFVGAGIYIGFSIIFWYSSGKPRGIENDMISILIKKYKLFGKNL